MEGASSKKRSLEELSKEELVKKCRSLLEIAQRAKQTKDALTEENVELKEKLKRAAVADELIESLTEEKLRMVSSLDDLSRERRVLDERLGECERDLDEANRRVYELDNENQSVKRQKVRLVTENEQLIVHLDGLEKQIEELKAIGLAQQQQLLQLEENNRILESGNLENPALSELQQMLSVSLEEVKKLKHEREVLDEKMENSKLLIEERDKNLSTLGAELMEKKEFIQGLQDELLRIKNETAGPISEGTLEALRKEIESLHTEIETKNREIGDKNEEITNKKNEIEKLLKTNDDLNTEINKNKASIEQLKSEHSISESNKDLENINDRLREKLKTYHSKLVKFAGEIKKLKESRNYLLKDFKTYNEQVKSWQEQLVVVMRRLSKEINEEEFEKFKLKGEIETLNVEIVSLSDSRGKLIELNELNASLGAENKRLEGLLRSKNVTEEGKSEIVGGKSKEGSTAQTEEKSEFVEGNVMIPGEKQFQEMLEELAEQKKALSSKNDELIKFEELLEVKNNEMLEFKKNLEERSDELMKAKTVIEERNNELIEVKKKFEENVTELTKVRNYCEELKHSQAELIDLKKQIEETAVLKKQINQLELDKDEFKSKHESIIKENNSLIEELKNDLQKHKSIIEENNLLICELKNAIERLESEVERSKSTETKLAEQSGQEIIKLANENKELRDKNSSLEVKISQLERESKSSEALFDLEEKVSSLKRENAELLAEMNEMNQALKERGETISKQQAYCDEILKKISHYENQASKNVEKIEESEVRIKELEDELERVKNRDEKERVLEDERNERVSMLKKENLELCERIEDLRKELELWKEKYSVNKNEDLQERNNFLLTENKYLNDKINNLGKVIRKSNEDPDMSIKDFIQSNKLIDLLEMKEEAMLIDLNFTENTPLIDSNNQNDKQIKNLQPPCSEIGEVLHPDNQNDLLRAENKQLNDKINSLTKEMETLKREQNEVSEMRKEIASLKDKLNTSVQENYAESETLSTSTISRSEEASRLKDLEGSWEERYGKLRTLAIKLKGKIRELTNELTREQTEKTELQNKLANTLKTVQTTQTQCDGLQDEIEVLKKENKGFNKKLENLQTSANKDKEQLTQYAESISKLKTENEVLVKEKSQVELWKKQVSTKVQSLKKELEANAVLKKDYEARLQKLNSDLENKEKELKDERDKHNQTKNNLLESNNECKKRSVLNLEMQDYERSAKELTSKLEKKNELVNKLKNQIDGQKSTVSSTKEQNRLLEERTNSLELELEAYRIEVNAFKKNVTELEMALLEKENKIQEVLRNVEVLRGENEDLSTQLSNALAENQKGLSLLRGEKDHFRSENLGLEQRLRETEDKLRLKGEELESVRNEYQGYKVRAQSVLRQNQTRDVGLEEKLVEEAATLRAQVDILKTEIAELKIEVDKLGIENEKLKVEKVQLESNKLTLLNDVDECRKELEKVNSKYQQAVMDHAETVRGLKVHADTLSQCYRQQITEQEARHNREIIELQSKLEKGSGGPPDIPSLVVPTTPREEGEGSESVDSTNGNVHPLEKLLGADQDQELSLMRKQLTENELKVTHLTALLADTEQDLAKHVQMNKVLKEEIRRQQRSVEREKHAENLEYMKNVVFKFITLSSGDERQRLVPVLNTILKLSPEETHKLNLVARGDKSWSNYLPLWSSPKQ